MRTSPRFDAGTLLLLRRVREVRIETTSLDGSQARRVIIWVVVVGDQVYVRSVEGERGRWYREALRRPDVVLHAESEAIEATAVLANDDATIEDVSDAFREKYGKRSPGSTAMMLQPHTLQTTLRLDPR